MPDRGGAQPVDTFSFRTVIILHACAIALFVFGTGAGKPISYTISFRLVDRDAHLVCAKGMARDEMPMMLMRVMMCCTGQAITGQAPSFQKTAWQR
jgi:hypothetical protein